MPDKSTANSSPVKLNPNLMIFRKLIPNMIGMLMKKENSVAIKREVPNTMLPRIEEPEREVPGMIDSAWNKPIWKAFIYVNSLKSVMLGSRSLCLFSMTMNKIP